MAYLSFLRNSKSPINCIIKRKSSSIVVTGNPLLPIHQPIRQGVTIAMWWDGDNVFNIKIDDGVLAG